MAAVLDPELETHKWIVVALASPTIHKSRSLAMLLRGHGVTTTSEAPILLLGLGMDHREQVDLVTSNKALDRGNKGQFCLLEGLQTNDRSHKCLYLS